MGSLWADMAEKPDHHTAIAWIAGNSETIMRLNRVLAHSRAAAILAIVTLVGAVGAHAQSAINLSAVRIDNFGKINGSYYRGAQPDEAGYADLAALGVRTVIDLTRDGRSDEPGLVERAGMKFYRIPLTTTDRPAESDIATFLHIVNDPASQPVYVHCQGGRHRTGAMTAVYRMTSDGWSADRAYSEMKQFNFEGFPGHPTLKQFVYDYYTRLAGTRVAASQSAEQTVAQR
jgi:protein tyrosine/serine phosphatase